MASRSQALSLAWFFGIVGLTTASELVGCTDAQICADGTVDGAHVVGHTCTEISGSTVVAYYGNTLDPQCLGGALSCTDSTSYLTEADCTGAGKYWSATTCDQLQAYTP